MWLARTANIELADPPPPMLGRHPFLATNGCTVVVGAIGGAEEFDTPPDDRSRLMWSFEGEAVTVGVSVTVGTSLPELIAGVFASRTSLVSARKRRSTSTPTCWQLPTSAAGSFGHRWRGV